MHPAQAIPLSRSWAIPAISGLLVLHSDFNTPRLANINRLEWADTSVDVFLDYGLCNVSRKVVEATAIIVTLHRDGAIAIRKAQNDESDVDYAFLGFLAGEVSRETTRWKDEMRSWQDDEKTEFKRASVLSICSALVALPVRQLNLVAEKDLSDPACIRKVISSFRAMTIEITPSGFHGVTFFLKYEEANRWQRRLYQNADIRPRIEPFPTRRVRLLKNATFRTRHLMLLPWAALVYLSEKIQETDPALSVATVDYLPGLAVDSSGGESLSALFS